MSLYSTIVETIESLDTATISPSRKMQLQPLIDYIQEKYDQSEIIQLQFICTHNSRRSHLTQIWAQTLAAFYQVPMVSSYSAGTVVTALYPQVAKTLSAQGFIIFSLSETENPVYGIRYAEDHPPVIGFSKTMDHVFNPKKNFAAIMTCSHADENCPFVPGAAQRISLPFDDPKAYDDTPLKATKYQERSLQIANELNYVFSSINKLG